MPRKEKTNAKTWERERRNRMNLYFKTLADLLPPNLEGKNRNKVDILIQASKYIKDLTNRTEELFYANAIDAHKEELNRLKKLVAQLYSRTQLLSTLLKDAGITVPVEPALEKISPLKWSTKINVEDTEKFIDRFKEKKKPEKRKSKSVGVKTTPKRKISGSTAKKTNDKDTKSVNVSEDQENCVNGSVKSSDQSSESPSKSSESQSSSASVSSNETTSKVDTKSSGRSKPDSRRKTKKSGNDDEEAKKKINSNNNNVILPSKNTNSIANLMPGTIILSGGKIMPLVTPITQLSSNLILNSKTNQSTNQIILGNNQSNPMIVMQPLSNKIENTIAPVCNQKVTGLNGLSNLRTSVKYESQDWVSNVKTIIEASKIGGRKGILPKSKEITKTTMTYKVPIPAVHRDLKANKNSDDTKTSTDKTDINKKSKRPSKSKKSTDKSKSKSEKISENSGNKDSKKRKNSDDSSESSPPKLVKILPETCESIENLRHVIEKIGESTEIKNPSSNPDKSDKIDQNMNIKTDQFEQSNTENSAANVDDDDDDDDRKKNEKDDKLLKEVNCGGKKGEVDYENSSEVDKNSLSKSCESEINQVTDSKSMESVNPLEIDKKSSLNCSTTPLSDVDKVIAETEVEIDKEKDDCDLGTRLDNLLRATEDSPMMDVNSNVDSTKIILNLDTNTTTTMKPEENPTIADQSSPTSSTTGPTVASETNQKNEERSRSSEIPKNSLSYSSENSFIPIGKEALHSDLSNDLFASLQVPSSSHNPESISPTAAFLMAFPLVSSMNGKTEVLEEDMKEDLKYHSQTPPMLLQIGAIEPNSFKVKTSEEKCPEISEKTNSKSSECQSESKAPVNKALPKIINTEPCKERYKIVPYSESSGNNFNNSSTTSSNVTTSSTSQSTDKKLPELECNLSRNIEDDNRKIPQLSSGICLPTSKFDNNLSLPPNVVTSSSSTQSKSEASRYPALPEYLQSYSNFGGLNLSDQNLSTDHSRSYSMTQVSSSQNYTYTMAKESLQYEYTSRKDSYQNGSQNPYATSSKESSAQISYPDYSLSKENSTVLDSSSFIPPQNYLSLPSNKEPSSSQLQIESFENLDRNYRKDSFIPGSTTEQTKQTKSQVKTAIDSTENKIPSDHFGPSENYSYDNKNTKSNSLVPDTLYQSKRDDSNSYLHYSRDQKKIFDGSNSSNVQISKDHGQLPSRYPHQIQHHQHQQTLAQQQQTCATSSSYGQTGVTDNLGKSTTTSAHNASNFSISSWTTMAPFVPATSNNNNLVQFESTNDHVDETEGKSICENFSYNQIHKENVGFNNMMPPETFGDSNITSVDKTKAKLNHKPIFEDSSKGKSVIGQQKSNRTNINEDFSKKNNKNSYTMDSSFTQTEFGIDQSRNQQHGTSKSQQIVLSKPEKSSYSVTGYESQVSFDITDPVGPSKCPDVYPGSNYKDQQLKYQSNIVQTQPSIINHENTSYNKQSQVQQSNLNKSKAVVNQEVQHNVRPPVNWMMTPEIKHNNISDLILPPIGKELEFCPNNIFNQASTYNQSTPNQFYNNYDITVSGCHTFSNVSTLQSDPRRISDSFFTEDQSFSWSPTKNSQAIDHNQIKSIDQQGIPSTLPTLVGDLALGTNISEKQSYLFNQIPPKPSNDLKSKEKDPGRDYQVMLNNQTVQHTQGTSFLSVSQLVKPAKVDEAHNQQNHHHNPPLLPPPPPPPPPPPLPPTSTSTSSLPHHQQQVSQRKHPKKNNTSPRSTGKRQIDIRKSDQLHPDDKVSTFNDQSFQQQHQHQQQPSKYQQHDVLWRNRNCKSNYTAEALSGVNNSSVQDTSNSDKQLTLKFSDYSQNKFSTSLATSDMVMPSINYLANSEEVNGYGQVMNQNFNHSSYSYSPNANIYPSTNFIAGIPNTASSYMMPLHENPPEYLETNSFLLPNVSKSMNTSVSSSTTSTRTSSSSANTTTNPKNNHQPYASATGKNQNCDKRNSYSTASKKSKRKSDNIEFPITGITSMEDYHPHHHHHHHHHHHTSTFLPHATPLYQNHPTVGLPNNRTPKSTTSSGNSIAMGHHPSGTSLTNFNLSTIFPEYNDKVTGYKSLNAIPSGLSQSNQNNSTANYPQRVNYSTNNTLGHVPQVSEATHFTTDLPNSPPSTLHYKTT